MWYTSYTEGFFLLLPPCQRENINILEHSAGCDGFQRPVSDCVGDGVDDIIKYSYFLLQLSESRS